LRHRAQERPPAIQKNSSCRFYRQDGFLQT
jgi:hypothetical protein